MNISINLKRYNYLKGYFALKYDGAEPLALPKGHKIHRKLEILLTCNTQCFRVYADNFLELQLPKFEFINTDSYNKLTNRGEHYILQTLRNEFFADFEDYADEFRELGSRLIVDSFIEKNKLDAALFDMLIKHLQRRPEKTKKLWQKKSVK